MMFPLCVEKEHECAVSLLSAGSPMQRQETCAKPSKLDKKPQHFPLFGTTWVLATVQDICTLLHDPLGKEPVPQRCQLNSATQANWD